MTSPRFPPDPTLYGAEKQGFAKRAAEMDALLADLRAYLDRKA